jgi:monofunctional glycosyltransferase
MVKWVLRSIAQWVAVVALSLLALQLFFVGRIALMAVVNPQSTTFERSEARRLIVDKGDLPWRQEWVSLEQISEHLKRAVIASEDAGFVDHRGVDWGAVESAWERNQRAESRALRGSASAASRTPVKVIGGSTITQQLAKNLLLSGERTTLRKAQELVLTWTLEACLSKRRILEIYLNHVEWGEGVFGAAAAAQHYFGVDARRLTVAQAAKLAVMLPAPKRFEKRPGSPYLVSRTGTVLARMPSVALP